MMRPAHLPARTRDSASSGMLARLRDDDGITLATVMAVASILFMLSTMVLMLSTNLTSNTRSQEGRTKALHAADAGLNAYLYELRRNPTFFVTSPTLGPTTLGDTIWEVTSTAPVGTEPLRLTARGTVPSMNTVRVVQATVRFPTYADYMFLSNDYLNFGSAAVVYGKVRSNSYIINAGTFKAESYAVGTITGAGTFEGTKHPGSAKVDYAFLTTDLSTMRTVATASNTYFASSSTQIGYRVILSGTNAALYKVTAENSTTGALTTTLIKTIAIPSSGVLFFDQDVWVSGNYAAMVTVVSSKNVYIPDIITATYTDRSFTCGVIADGEVIVKSWYSAMPTNMRIEAAMLARTGSVRAELKTGKTKASLVIDGSMSDWVFGGFVYSDNSAGFLARQYIYSQRLNIFPPPFYPRVRDGVLKVSTWVEQ
jgi:hypothetical protein